MSKKQYFQEVLCSTALASWDYALMESTNDFQEMWPLAMYKQAW